MRRKRMLGVIGLALAPVWIAGSAAASSIAQTSTQVVSNPFSPVSDSDFDSGAHGVGASAISTSSQGGLIFAGGAPLPPVGSQSGTTFAAASATEGVLRARAGADSFTSPLVQNAINAQGSASAQWSDSLIVSAAGLTGQSGTITASIVLSGTFGTGIGTLGPLDDPLADAYMRILGTGLPTSGSFLDPDLAAICGGWAFCGRSIEDALRTYSGSNFPGNVITVSIPVVFGSATTLGFTIDVFARASSSSFAGGIGTSAGATSNFSSTLRWGGILGVFDANGNQIQGYAATSASGFDYTVAAVPTPSASALLAVAVAALAQRWRRQR